ncbi:MAG: hypothetical protein O7A67_10870 [SAR324 cluster bacterium]|nr:hypothetical protein [SAR324 cluster bacterium]
MKALHFAKPLEFRLETPAETLTQGESFSGTFQATNRGAEALDRLDLQVTLAYAEFKALKESPESAFAVQEHLELAADATLEPGGEFAAPWSLALASDCPITSKTGGLFLLYGEGWERPGRFGKLDLRVTLAPVVEAYLATLENVFSFVADSCRFDGAFTEVRLKPPSRYATLERLQLLIRYREEGMELVYQAKVKGFGRGRSGLTSKNVTLEQKLAPDQVLMGGNRPNRAFFKTSIESTLGELVPPILQ